MRGPRSVRWRWIGAGVAAVVALVGVYVVASRGPDDVPRTSAAADLVEAWTRSRTSTFVARGTWERLGGSGNRLASDAYLAQRPPRRLQRELGGVQGRVDDRLLLCPAGPEGDAERCRLGAPSGEGYDAAVAAEVEALGSLVLGDDPLYAVEAAEAAGCYVLTQQRSEPRAPYGVETTVCFDAATGAPRRREVRFAEGVTETVVYDEISPSVAAADLRP